MLAVESAKIAIEEKGKAETCHAGKADIPFKHEP